MTQDTIMTDLAQTKEINDLPNVTIYDNGSCFMIQVNGLSVHACRTLGDAWVHIEWMYIVASQRFTVGPKKVIVTEWIDAMHKIGYLG